MMPTPRFFACSTMTKEPFGLAIGERCGRLVEDQHRQPGAERFRDLHHLLLGAGEIVDALARAQRKAELREDSFGAAMQFDLVEDAVPGHFGAEE